MLRAIAIAFFALTTSCYATVKCPPNKRGEVLTCAFACCRSLDATFEVTLCFYINAKAEKLSLFPFFKTGEESFEIILN